MRKYSLLIMAAVITLGLFVSTMSAMSAGAQGAPEDVAGNQAQKRMQAGETLQLRFRNGTQLKMSGNCTMDVNMDVDSDNIGEQSFSLALNSTENLNVTMKAVAEMSELGLQNGNTIQARNQNRYQYQQKLCLQLQVNGTMRAKLGVANTTQGATWAYYDEAAQEFVPVNSEVVNGELICETDHFSTWTVLQLEDEPTIDGYGLYALVPLLGLAVFGLIRKYSH